MSINTSWNIDSYREEHESEDHWELRKAFMEKWKTHYPEERLVCLGRVFANIELLGCRYPAEVMKEVSGLSFDIAKVYRNSRKDKLKRTFVSASNAAEDRARGVKREGGVVKDGPSAKSKKISFLPQGHKNNKESSPVPDDKTKFDEKNDSEESCSKTQENNEYLTELMKLECIDINRFNEKMFQTSYGRMVLIVRPWTGKLSNIQASCQACNIPIRNQYENGTFTLFINGKIVAQASSATKALAKGAIETMAWEKLCSQLVILLVKQQWIAQGDSKVTVSEVTGRRDEFGTPVENSVATKMMQMMGWKGGGLGADLQGIAEPIKPHLQMVNRAGLGSQSSDARHLRRAAETLMQRYLVSDSLDVDLVFSSEFSKEERAVLHQVAMRSGLASKSYGTNENSSPKDPARRRAWIEALNREEEWIPT